MTHQETFLGLIQDRAHTPSSILQSWYWNSRV